MDPPAETETEILEVDHNASSPTDDGNTPAAADDAVSMVLDNGDLLLEIMLRLDLPTTLVRAILVCKRWFLVASEPFSLRCFRRRHKPRLLGFYVATRSTTRHVLLRPRFVAMPPPEADQPPPPPESEQPPPPPESEQPPPPESDQPRRGLVKPPEPESDQPPPQPESDQPPEPDHPPPESDQPPEPDQPPPESDQPPPREQEFAAAVRMAETYSLDAYEEDLAYICDLQNDTMLLCGRRGESFTVDVHWPMSPHRGVVAIPVIPYDQWDGTAATAANFILKVQWGRSDSLVFVWLSLGFLFDREKGEYSVKYKAHIYVLQEDGQWRFRASAAAVLPSPKSDSRPLLVGTKIYLEHSTSIAVLDVKTSTFSAIPLPEGMERYDYKDMMLAAYYDSGVCLIHLDEDLQLFIWLHIPGGTGTPSWRLVDLTSLPEIFETLGMTGWTDDDQPATLFQTAQMGDFVEFVFLKLGQCAFCLDTRRRVLCKVYEVTQEDQTLEQLHPLMTTWPPKFPALKGDHLARNVS